MNFTTESRLPPHTSSQIIESGYRLGLPCFLLPNRGSRLISSKFIDESRSRWVLPCTLSPNHGSRFILRHKLLEDRGLASDFLANYDCFCVVLSWHNLWRNQWRNPLITCIAVSGATHGVNSIVTCGACPIRPSGSARRTRPSSSVAWFFAPNRPSANFSCVSLILLPPLCRFLPLSLPVLFSPSPSLSLSLSLFCLHPLPVLGA